MNNSEKPIANSLVVLREEFDDWAVLFDPDTGHGFGLNPTGVYAWKLLDGEHTINDMLKALRGEVRDMPQETGEHLAAFIEELTREGLAGYDAEQGHDDRGRLPPCPACVCDEVSDAAKFTYEPPRLVDLSRKLESAYGECCYGSGASGSSSVGVSASGCCDTGTSGTMNPCCAYGGCAARQSTNCWSTGTAACTCAAGNGADYY